MAYRDDLEAANTRADDLQRELEDVRSKNANDAERIARLQRELWDAQRHLHYLGNPESYYPLPQSNATMVLVFGILSLTVCALFGPFAWYYGNVEIQKMDYGQVDPTSRGSAVAGKVCGIISSCLLMLIVFLFFLGFAAG